MKNWYVLNNDGRIEHLGRAEGIGEACELCESLAAGRAIWLADEGQLREWQDQIKIELDLARRTEWKYGENADLIRAVRDFASMRAHRSWKVELRCAWASGDYRKAGVFDADQAAALQRARNVLGPEFLASFNPRHFLE